MSNADKSLSDELIVHPRQLKVHGSLAILAKDIADILQKNFPGWLWVIEPDQQGQVINIFNHHLHDRWGYTIRTTEIHNDPKRRLAYTAGREILQRFGLEPRGLGPQAALYHSLKRDHHGKIVPVHARDRMTRQQIEQETISEEADRLVKLVEAST